MAKKRPELDDIVDARRREGYSPVSTDFTVLRQRNPKWEPTEGMVRSGMVSAGDVIPMRFEEAVARHDFEAIGWEKVGPDDLPVEQPDEPEAEEAPAAPGQEP